MQNYIIESYPINNLAIDRNIFKSDKESFKLQPMHAAYLRYFIRKRKLSSCKDSCIGCEECFVNYDQIMYASQKEILDEHRKIKGEKNQHYIFEKP